MNPKQTLRKRDIYLNKLIAFKDTEPVKVVTGVRRCGKSINSNFYKNLSRTLYFSKRGCRIRQSLICKKIILINGCLSVR